MRRCKMILSYWLKVSSILLLLLYAQLVQAQVRSYNIKNGKMFITVGKDIAATALDSFIKKYELTDLDLQHFIKNGKVDSLHKLGWKVDVNNKEIFVISKPLFSATDISNPLDKIIFTQKEGGNLVVPVNQVHFGINKFKNKPAFSVEDSVVSFFLRAQTNASNVKLAGSFTNWQNGALPMRKTDSGWIAYVKMAAGKHLYKFIIDNNWSIDKDNSLVENDDKGNDNSVYFKTNYTFTLNGYTNAKRLILSGSFNNWKEKELLMQRTAAGWTLPVYLSEGTHTYRFIADGNWFIDPANAEKLPNEFNDYNSVIRIGNPYIFKLNGFPDAKKVFVLGSFNNWKNNELQMTKTATGWILPYTLGPGNYEYRLSIDGKLTMDGVTKGNQALVIDPNFTFRLKGFDNAKTVCVAGDINNWNPTSFRMERVGDEWIFPAHLNKGKHRYKFVIDGKWILDPANKLWEQNEHNTGNSILWIEEQ
jgi:1,4-alpha-glucan branching enzyme